MASRNIFLPKESNRRIPNGTYGGVRGMNNLYSIAFPTPEGRLYGFLFSPGRQPGCMVLLAHQFTSSPAHYNSFIIMAPLYFQKAPTTCRRQLIQ